MAATSYAAPASSSEVNAPKYHCRPSHQMWASKRPVRVCRVTPRMAEERKVLEDVVVPPRLARRLVVVEARRARRGGLEGRGCGCVAAREVRLLSRDGTGTSAPHG